MMFNKIKQYQWLMPTVFLILMIAAFSFGHPLLVVTFLVLFVLSFCWYCQVNTVEPR